MLYDKEFALRQLLRKYDLRKCVDIGQPILFGQRSVNPNFGKSGFFKGAAIDDIANQLLTGKIKPFDLKIQYLWVNGQKVVINNRSLTTLSMAGFKPLNVFDMTGKLKLFKGPDNLLSILYRLEEIGGAPRTFMPVRTGGNWFSPISKTVDLITK